MNSLFSAWAAWLGGHPAPALWGVSTTWWIRSAKLLEFWSGLTIVFDLLGPEPFERAGQRLSVRAGKATEYLEELADWARLIGLTVGVFAGGLIGWFGYNLAWDAIFRVFEDNPKPYSLPFTEASPALIIGSWVSLCILGSILRSKFEWAKDSNPPKHRGFTYWLWAYGVEAPGVPVGGAAWLAVMAVPALIWAIATGTLTATVIVLKKSKVTNLLKWCALALFVIGFHFDLLYSA